MNRSLVCGGVLLGLALCSLAWLVPGQSGGLAEAAPMPAKAEAARLSAKLATPVTLDKGIEANTPLKDALDFLSDKFGLTILINGEAFKNDLQEAEPENHPVRLPKMRDVRLETVLRLLLVQVQGTYIVRPDHIEITTQQRVIAEVWGNIEPLNDPVPGGFGLPPVEGKVKEAPSSRKRPLLRLVHAAFDKRPLDEAARELAQSTGFSIVIDTRRAGDKARAAVSAAFHNVPLDTAVRLLANQAELKVVLVDNVLYVTTEENARAIHAEQEKLHQSGLEQPPSGPAAPPGA